MVCRHCSQLRTRGIVRPLGHPVCEGRQGRAGVARPVCAFAGLSARPVAERAGPASAERGRARRVSPGRIPWDGILVDDEGDEGQKRDIITASPRGHRSDLEGSSRGHRTGSLRNPRREILARLFPQALRLLRRPPEALFQEPAASAHLLALSTASGSYTLWIYYHRLTGQTLHLALADFVDPKLKSVQYDITVLRERTGGRDSQFGELQEFLGELTEFRAEIERIIKLPWKPDLNDGVLITASPLWKLFRLPNGAMTWKPVGKNWSVATTTGHTSPTPFGLIA